MENWALIDQTVRKGETRYLRDESLAPCHNPVALTGTWMLHGPYTSTPTPEKRAASHITRHTCFPSFHLDSSLCVATDDQETMVLIPFAGISIASYRTIAWQKPSRKWRCQNRGMHTCFAKVQMAAWWHTVLLLILFLEWLQMLENKRMLSLGNCLQTSHTETLGKWSGRQDAV